MPNLISSAIFVGDIALPNVVGSGAQASQLTTFITRYETQYLQQIFGIEFYDTFIAEIAAGTDAYEAIRDGDSFVDTAGITRQWLGLDNVGSSPIASYIYYQVMKYNVSQTQGVGESMSAVENGTSASSSPKMVNAWNDMVDWNLTLHEYLYANRATFTTYIGLDYPPSQYNTMSNQNLFEYINIYGI